MLFSSALLYQVVFLFVARHHQLKPGDKTDCGSFYKKFNKNNNARSHDKP
jgi:hypothetical protein